MAKMHLFFYHFWRGQGDRSPGGGGRKWVRSPVFQSDLRFCPNNHLLDPKLRSNCPPPLASHPSWVGEGAINFRLLSMCIRHPLASTQALQDRHQRSEAVFRLQCLPGLRSALQPGVMRDVQGPIGDYGRLVSRRSAIFARLIAT